MREGVTPPGVEASAAAPEATGDNSGVPTINLPPTVPDRPFLILGEKGRAYKEASARLEEAKKLARDASVKELGDEATKPPFEVALLQELPKIFMNSENPAFFQDVAQPAAEFLGRFLHLQPQANIEGPFQTRTIEEGRINGRTVTGKTELSVKSGPNTGTYLTEITLFDDSNSKSSYNITVYKRSAEGETRYMLSHGVVREGDPASQSIPARTHFYEIREEKYSPSGEPIGSKTTTLDTQGKRLTLPTQLPPTNPYK